MYGGYGTFDQITGMATVLGLVQIQKESSAEIEDWIYDVLYIVWLYDHLLVLGLLIVVFFKYDLIEPFKKIRRIIWK